MFITKQKRMQKGRNLENIQEEIVITEKNVQ